MKALITALGNKYFLWALIVISVFCIFQVRSCQIDKNDELQTYNRQLQGQLSEKEVALQSANHELGILQSNLMTQKELINNWKKEKEELDEEFDKFRNKHDLQIRSKDKTIAKLKQQILGGDTNVNIEPVDDSDVIVISPDQSGCSGIEDKCVISYKWEETLKRFSLYDPNIFEKNNEVFESEQLFKVYGEVWQQDEGSLQVKRLVLREVYLGESGKYENVINGKAEIIDSKFEYHNPPSIKTEFDWTDLFRIRTIALGSVTAVPAAGQTRLGVGMEFFNVVGFGINTHTALDFKNAEKIEQRIGFGYSPKISDLNMNVAIGISAGTPFAHMFNDYSINADLIFYLHD